MHTFTGNRIEVGKGYTPTLTDIAWGLSKTNRWGGATIVPWNVLQHSLAIFALTEGEGPILRSAALFHDIEEFATGDIPRGFKTVEQEMLGDDLRKRLYRETLRLPYPDNGTLGRVKMLDNSIARAESDCLCHPKAREYMQKVECTPAAWDTVWDLVDIEPREGVHLFVEIAKKLLDDPRMKALSARV